MTPGARIAAAIDALDEIVAGAPAERTLTRWARASRFAGSKDRAAVRDLVFDVLRCRASSLWVSGAEVETGRALILGYLAMSEPEALEGIDGVGHAPQPISAAEQAQLRPDLSDAPAHVRGDYPAFLEPEISRSLGDRAEEVMQHLRSRAPVDLRVNGLRGTVDQAIASLRQDDIAVETVAGVPQALRIADNPRRLAQSGAYKSGLVELQDAASQCVAATVGAAPGMSVLDYCAGGGGKTLALAVGMAGQGRLCAFDANPRRMRDLPARAARAGATVEILGPADLDRLAGQFDRVLADVPCSGSGAWRRNPDQKWRISEADLAELLDVQIQILTDIQRLIRPGGKLVFATCSILRAENEDQSARLLTLGPRLKFIRDRRYLPGDPGDGFYVSEFLVE